MEKIICRWTIIKQMMGREPSLAQLRVRRKEKRGEGLLIGSIKLSMAAGRLWRGVLNAVTSSSSTSNETSASEEESIEFWKDPEKCGWLTKQGEYIKTWRRRWFVLKQGKLFWFKESVVGPGSSPRGVIPIGATCLTVKGAEDVLNRPFAFELSTSIETMYFIADSDKDKEEWINSIGRSIVQHSRSLVPKDSEVLDYNNSQ